MVKVCAKRGVPRRVLEYMFPVYFSEQLQPACIPIGVYEEVFSFFFFVALALIFIAREARPSLSLVDKEVECCLLTSFSASISPTRHEVRKKHFAEN